jgi:hypothetical protein
MSVSLAVAEVGAVMLGLAKVRPISLAQADLQHAFA